MRRFAKSSSRRCALAITAAVALWLHADPSAGARLTAVRVGSHPGYTRVVLQTDAPAAFQLLEESADAPGEVTVRIDAASSARDVTSREPGAPRVEVLPQADGTTLARIRASGPLRVETQVLATPPRLVLDLRRAPRDAALPVAAPVSEPAPEIAPVTQPEVVAAPPPTPDQVALVPTVTEPTPVVTTTPAPPIAPAPDPAPAEAPTAIEVPPTIDEPPSVAAPPRAAVEAPPRADPGIDPLSLALGIATGFGVALIAITARRQRRDPVVASASETEVVTLESVSAVPVEASEVPEALEAVATPEPMPVEEPSPESAPPPEARDEWMLDVLRMHQRLDARLAEIADRLGELAQRQSRLESRGGAQNEELAAQRTAIARLQRALRPASPAASPRQVR